MNNTGGWFDSFSNFVGKIGQAASQVGQTVGNFITQRYQLEAQKAQAQAQLAALKAQARAASRVQAQPVALSNAQRAQAARQAPASVAGIPMDVLVLGVGGFMLYKLLK